MTPELNYLAMISTITALMWMPYVLNIISKNKLSDVENLVVFATLVLIANALDISNNATTSAAATYFWARLVHAGAYTFGIPWVRTLAFVVAWGGILCIAWQVLA